MIYTSSCQPIEQITPTHTPRATLIGTGTPTPFETIDSDIPNHTEEAYQRAIPVGTGTPIPFETIDSDIFSRTGKEYQGEDPRILILIELNELSKINGISSDASMEIAQTDFDQDFVIAVFQGRQGTDGYGVVIRSVSRVDDHILVYSEFITPQRHHLLLC